MFEFPTYEQLQKFQNVVQKSAILSFLQGFKGVQQFKDQQIRYQIESYVQMKDQNQKIDHLMIEFKCCTGIANHKPFLHFVKNQNNLFQISNQNCWHDHSLIQQKQIFRYELKQTNQLKQILPKPMEQEEKKFSQTESFDFPLETQLESLREFDSKEAIKQAYKNLSEEPHHKTKNIKFDFQQVNLISAVINYRLNILFECCNEQQEPAFLSYTSSDGKKYLLSKSYNLRHIHDKKQQQDHNQIEDNKNFGYQQQQNLKNGQNQIIPENQEEIHQIVKQEKAYEKKDMIVRQYIIIQSDHDSKQQRIGGSNFSSEMEEQKFVQKPVSQKQNQAMEVQPSSDSSSLDNPVFENLKPVEKGLKSSGAIMKSNQVEVEKFNKVDNIMVSKLGQPKLLTRSQCQAWKKENNINSDVQSSRSDGQQSQIQKNQSGSLRQESQSQNYQKNEKKSQQVRQSDQQSEQNQGPQFLFPTDKELQRLKYGKNSFIRSGIHNLIRIRYKNRIEIHSKSYKTKDSKGRTIYNLLFDFDCCKGQQQRNQPFIHFISKSNKNGPYSLEAINQKHNHNENVNLIKSGNKKNDDINTSKKQQSKKNFEKNLKKNQMIPQRYQKRALEDNRNSRQVFKFPSEKDIEQIRPFSITSIRHDLNKLASRKHKRIKFHCEAQDKQNIKFYFDCCKGFQGVAPFINFKFVSYEQIFLIFQSNLWHDHRKESKEQNLKQFANKMIQENEQSLEEQNQSESSEVQDKNQNQDDENDIENQEQSGEEEQSQNSQEQQSRQDQQKDENQQQQEKNSNQVGQVKGYLRSIKTKIIQKPNKRQRNISTLNRKHQQVDSKNIVDKNQRPQKGHQVRAYWASKKKGSQVFKFPQDKQLQSLHQRPLVSIRPTISKLVKAYKNKGVKYSGQIQETLDKNNKKVDHYKVKFYCCQGFENQRPILHFERSNNQAKYKLVEIGKWHDHSKKSSQKKNDFSKQKKINSKEIEEPIANKKQNQIKNNINKNVQEISEKASDRKQFKESRQNQIQPQKTKGIFKAPVSAKNVRSSRPLDFVTPSKVQNNQSQQSEQQNYVNQQQRSVIQIHSQTERQNLQIYSNRNHQSIQVKKQNHLRDQNENSENFLTNKIGPINDQFRVHKQNQIFYWLHKYNQKISAFLLQKRLTNQMDNKFQQMMKKQFNTYFSSNFRDQDQNQTVWMKCIFKMMKQNGIEIIKIKNEKNHKQHENNCSYLNLLFLKKNQDINKLININAKLKIYLAVYPIKITQISQPLKIFLAYMFDLQDNPQILWFYICKQNSAQVNVGDFLEDDQQIDLFDQAFKESIKHFKLRNTHINFIYTTLDHQLITTLDKICQSTSQSNSQKRFSSTMHLSCIDALMKTENISQNSQLGIQIGMRFKKSSNFSNVKASYKILKNILNRDENQSQNFINPRVTYDHYKNFAELFSNKNLNEPFQFTLAFFSSELLYKKSQKTMIDDSISQLNSILAQIYQFNHIAEIIALVVRFFSPTQIKLFKLATNTSIISSKFYETQKQRQNFYQISQKYKESQYSIDKIFAEPAYELSLIIKKCPRFIIQTIYRLILSVNQLTLKKKNQYPIPKNPKFYQFKENQQNQKIYKVLLLLHDQQKKKNQKQNYSIKTNKKWTCECKFYEQTGIPCEHQILAALINKDSLFKEINQCWKCEKQ